MPTASVITLGCRLNQADTALLTARLMQYGIRLLPYSETDGADVLILNSCAVTASASRKSRQSVHALKKRHPGSLIAVTGCAATVEAEPFDAADIVLPNARKVLLADRIAEKLNLKTVSGEEPLPFEPVFRENALSEFPFRSRANLKIQEGCNNFCSYCIVPYARGRERSRDLQETLADFRHLVEAGFGEITLTGINTCSYACGNVRLPELLELLLEIPGRFRIRIGSTEPGPVLEKVVDVMAAAKGRICEFLHPSLQHGSDEILRKMNRHYLTEDYRRFAAYARSKVPLIHLGTDVITGFPGETDALFERSLQFVQEISFANLHIFPYSPRKGTPAAEMKDHVPESVSAERAARLRIAGEKSRRLFERKLKGSIQSFVAEDVTDEGAFGWTGNYVRTFVPGIRPEPGSLFEVVTGERLPGKECLAAVPFRQSSLPEK